MPKRSVSPSAASWSLLGWIEEARAATVGSAAVERQEGADKDARTARQSPWRSHERVPARSRNARPHNAIVPSGRPDPASGARQRGGQCRDTATGSGLIQLSGSGAADIEG